MLLQRLGKKATRKFNELMLAYGKVNHKKQGLINFIDVGSASGSIPDPWFENSKYIKNMLCFDPHNSTSPHQNIFVSKEALWKEEGQLPFYIYKGLNQSGSSLFEQNIDYVKENYKTLSEKGPKKLSETWFERSSLEKVVSIKVNTLDHVIDNLDQDLVFDFLKIDAQGAEYQILQGAEKFLNSDCLGLQLELFNIPLYKNIKLDAEVTDYLKNLGFQMVKKHPPHGTFDSQHDFIYLKSKVSKDKEEKLELLKKIYKIK